MNVLLRAALLLAWIVNGVTIWVIVLDDSYQSEAWSYLVVATLWLALAVSSGVREINSCGWKE